MLPYQKYPSAYRQQDLYNPPPQSPFDMAYGSSLLPRQLLVGSPFVQVQSPSLTSPMHYNPFNQRNNNTYYPVPTPPKLGMPPRRRNRLYHQETPSKQRSNSKPLALSIDSSSNDSADELEKQDIKSNSSASLNQLYTSTNSSSSTNITSSSQLPLSYAFQISKTPTRAMVLTCINPSISISKLLDYVTFGPLEAIRVVENYPRPGVNSIVLSFLKVETCVSFYNNLLTFFGKFKKLVDSPELFTSFIATKKILSFISHSINNEGATRNVFIGNLNAFEKEITEDFLQKEFQKFGIIDKIDLVEKKNQDDPEEKFAFIHFASIASAVKTVEQMNLNPFWADAKIFYGTDRCSLQDDVLNSVIDEINEDEDPDEEDRIKMQNIDLQRGVFLYNGEDLTGIAENVEDDDEDEDDYFFTNEHLATVPQSPFYSQQYIQPGYQTVQFQQPFQNVYEVEDALAQKQHAAYALAQYAAGHDNVGNRTICLYGLDPKSRVEDICNVVRGGILQLIKHFPEKKVCFLTFIEPIAATQFFAQFQLNQLMINGKRVRVGWGSHSGPVPNQISLAVTIGASRNVYIGKDEEGEENDEIQLPNEEVLRKDFENFGEIEQINYFKGNKCVFLNFLNITNAIKIVNDASGSQAEKFHEYFNDRYSKFKISYGKDRCGNPPKVKKSRKRKSKKYSNCGDSKNEEENQDEDKGDEEKALIETEVEGSSSHKVEDVPIEFFESMGISEKKEETDVESQELDAFGIASKVGSDSTLTSTPSSKALDKKDSAYNPQNHRRQSSSRKNSSNYSYSRNSSRASSQISLNQFHHTPSFQPSYPSAPKQHDLSTNGLQVMAQYLQQSQHANLIYAANVLNAVEQPPFGNEYYGNRPRRSREDKKR